jgi:hypothetical protein
MKPEKHALLQFNLSEISTPEQRAGRAYIENIQRDFLGHFYPSLWDSETTLQTTLLLNVKTDLPHLTALLACADKYRIPYQLSFPDDIDWIPSQHHS